MLFRSAGAFGCQINTGVNHSFFHSFRRKNIILSDVVEERMVDSSIYLTAKSPSRIITVKRRLSQAMIPGPHLVKVEVTRDVYDAAVKPALCVKKY